MDKSGKAREVLDILSEEFPDARAAIRFTTPIELLIAAILSAQTTDALVNRVTGALFKRYGSARDYAAAGLDDLEALIGSVNFFRNKARNIKACCERIASVYAGQVPDTMDALTTLPGVGRKTANIVLAEAFGKDALAVDTHVKRVSLRLGLARSEDPDVIEEELCGVIPMRRWASASRLFILHGRKTCKARRPLCKGCGVSIHCQYYAALKKAGTKGG
jgi:endonuclease-3